MIRCLAAMLLAATLLFLSPAVPGADDVALQPTLYSPPVLSNPVTVSVTTANRVVSLPATQDAIVEMGRVEGPVRIVGGHDIVLIGGRIYIPYAGEREDYLSDSAFIAARLGLYLKDNTGVVYVEGVRIDGPDLSEGIQIDSPDAAVTLANIRIEDIHARDEIGFTDNHPDLVQPWGGVRRLRIDGLTGTTDMQGIFLKGDFGPIGRVDIRRMNIRGTDTSRQLFWQHASFPVTLEDVWLEGAPGRWFGSVVWPQPNGVYPRQSFKTPDGRWMFYPETGITGAINEGSPPTGDFVPAGSVGAAYVRP